MRSRNSIIRRTVLSVAIATLTALAVTVGCAARQDTSQVMYSGSSAPAGEGTVDATAGDNGNTKLAVRVRHLAPASKIESDATLYVVWIQPQDGIMQSVGALVVNEDLVGSLDTTTPHRRFRLTVTPEPNGLVAQPTHDPVFMAQVARTD